MQDKDIAPSPKQLEPSSSGDLRLKLTKRDLHQIDQLLPNSALRYDQGKLRYDLLPADGIKALAEVYTAGAIKYAPRNWEKGMSWSRCFGSLMRHAWAFWRGEAIDKETGCHHMAMAAWNCIALCVYHTRQVGEDDRPVV